MLLAAKTPDCNLIQGDTVRKFEAQLFDGCSEVVDISLATKVELRLKLNRNEPVLDPDTGAEVPEVATVYDLAIVDGPTGKVERVWLQGETDIAGDFHGQIQVFWNTRVDTYPKGDCSFFLIRVSEIL